MRLDLDNRLNDLRPCVVFDLDDTLYDCTGQLKNKLIWNAARDLCEEIPGSVESVYEEIIRTRRDHPLSDYFTLYLESRFGLLVDVDGEVERLRIICREAYSQVNDLINSISLFPGSYSLLESLKKQGWRMFLLTQGQRKTQNKKIDVLGIRDLFEGIYICTGSVGATKLDVLRRIIQIRDLSVDRLVIVGDRPDSELTAGALLKARYLVHYAHGIYLHLKIKKIEENGGKLEENGRKVEENGRKVEENGLEDKRKINFRVDEMTGLRRILMDDIYPVLIRRLKIVCIGGGTGQPLLVSGLMDEVSRRKMRGMVDIDSVVAMTDSGRSSGRLRKLFNCPPPGDCRNCLIGSVSKSSRGDLHKIFQYRFSGQSCQESGDQGIESGSHELEGHSLGNLMLIALWKMNGGDFSEAVSQMSQILGVESGCRILPICNDVADVCAQLENGLAKGEVEVRRVGKSPINRVWVEYSSSEKRTELGDPFISDEVALSIENADLVILGPGSFWTSVMCNMVYGGIVESLRHCSGKVIWIANLTTQPGQTDKMTFDDHLKKLVTVIGKKTLSGIVINNGVPDPEVVEQYKKEGVNFIEHHLERGSIPMISEDLLESKSNEDRNLWNKQDCIRHDPSKLGKVIFDWILNR